MPDTFTIYSPNRRIEIGILLTDKVYYSVRFDGRDVLWDSPLSLTLGDGRVLGQDFHIQEVIERLVRDEIHPPWGIRKTISDHYDELELIMKGGYSILFRAYDNGVAYRFCTRLAGQIRVAAEEVAYRFLKDHRLLAHVVGDFQTSYEKLYTKYRISEVVEKDFISLPLLVDQGNLKLVVTEADLVDYPGMYLQRLENNNRFDLLGLFPEFPTAWEQGGLCQFNLRVTERASYLAETEGYRSFPWRLLIVEEEAARLATNDLVYQLAKPPLEEMPWVRPGKVAWDWWNDWNLEGVDFETGINNRTYEYYIDFAARNQLEYVILDEGWSDQFDLFVPRPGIDVPHLIGYGKQRGVRIILWCVWHTLDRQLAPALDQFRDWGAAGIKVDFIDRDDQIAINFYERVAREAARRQLLVNIHGCSKPTGLHRTYPNVLSFEGVRGNEYNKFDIDENPGHNVDLVFTRMIAGPMDYTPGAMRNSIKDRFFTDFNSPMSHGTRCHQLAMYVLYFSPMQMLCDAPTAYEKYPDILAFLATVPVVWDESVPLAGEVGKYIVLARKKEASWYIGAMTDWEGRELAIDLSFLPGGMYRATLFIDGVNAHRKAEDYRCLEREIKAGQQLKLVLKPGGGAALRLDPINGPAITQKQGI